MLRDRLAEVENLLERSPFVLARDLEYFITSSITAYIKGEVLFADGSRLSLFEHFRRKDRRLEMTDYRYHYMAKDDSIIFRYDNAPHHPHLEHFPFHKHLQKGEVVPANLPGFEAILEEIEASIVKKITK